MARFGLSPYSNPVESALQSFGTGLRDISLLRDLTSGNKEREEQQRRQLTDLQITGQQQRNQEFSDEAPNRALERETKNKELHTKIATQTYGPGIDSAARKAKDSIPTGQPPQFSADEIAGVLGFADQHSHFGGTKNEESEHVQQAVAANKVQQNLVQLAPALAQHSQQSGQTMHRIDNTVVPGFIDDVNAAFKNSSVFDGKEVEALGVDAATGEVTVRVKGKDGPELLKDKDGNIKKFSVNDLQNMVNKSASFGNLVLSSYAQMHGNDDLMKEVEGKKKEIADSHGRLATMDEYAEWEGKNPDATVAQKRTQIQKIGAKHGVSETALDKIAKEQIAEKKNPRSGLAGKETIVDGKRVYLDDEGKPTDIVAAPKERPPVDPVTGMIRQQHLDDAKSKRLSKETSDMDKKLAGEYSSEALNAIDSPDDKKKLDTKNIDAVSGYLPAEKKEELDKIRTVASRLIEEDGYTAERAVREAKAAYKKRSEKSKHEAFTHNQPGHL